MHQVELDGTRKYSKRSICSGAEGLRLNSQSEVEEVMCNCTRMHAPTRIDCLPIHFSAAEEDCDYVAHSSGNAWETDGSNWYQCILKCRY